MLPTLRTNRLILKPRTMDDLKEYVEMDLNPEVTQYIPGIWDGSQKHISFLEERIMKSYPPGLVNRMNHFTPIYKPEKHLLSV